MRQLFVSAMLAGLVGMAGFARDARAGATVDLLFVRGNGVAIAPTNTVGVGPGDTLTMAIFMRNDVPITVAIFGIGYDTDGKNELDIGSVVVWGGVPVAGSKSARFAPITPPSTINATLINEINSATNAPPPAQPLAVFGGAFAAAFPLGYQMGTVTWVVTEGVNTDGADITPGFNLQGTFGQVFTTTAGVVINTTIRFNSATVNLVDNIPEPGAAALLGLGLCGLALLRRRSRGGR